ncbi:MAG: flagellin, partial [Burkholderiaceae bacterium]|nr:flagellin [Burkholderiaceae bacterium]
DGTFGTQQFQVGANANQTIVAATANLRTNQYGNNQIIGTGADGVSVLPDTAPYSFSSNGVASGSLAINGALGSANIAVNLNESAKVTADNINAQTAKTGVSASARTAAQLVFDTTGAWTLGLRSENSNVETVSFSISAVSGADGLSGAISAINDKSSKTGITARLNDAGTGLILSNTTGSNIMVVDNGSLTSGTVTAQKMANDSNGHLATVGTAFGIIVGFAEESWITGGYIALDSEKSYGVIATSTNAMSTANSSLQKVSELDVSTFDTATAALKTVDSALGFINGERAKLGALQSRFETSINNLQVTSENLSSSRSRILDADFAAETANLSRAQILQQAGTAMVAQANQLPQGVLALLR